MFLRDVRKNYFLTNDAQVVMKQLFYVMNEKTFMTSIGLFGMFQNVLYFCSHEAI